MRIVHVASGRLFGGIEQMLVTMARSHDVTPDVDVAFAVAAPARLEQELRAAGAAVISLGDVRLSRPRTVMQARATLARRLESRPPAALVCHAPWSHALFAPVGRRRGVPVVFWQHDHASGRAWVEHWARSTRADLVICNSRWTAKTAAALQPGVPCVIVHPPVTIPMRPTANRSDLRASLETDPSSVVILCASRLEPWKGHLNVLRALGRLGGEPGWVLWIAGGASRPHEKDYLSVIRTEVDRLGLISRVRFLGEHRDVPDLMRAADLYCQMNDGPEPFGVVFAEALLSGVPVVTANLGGAPEIVSSSCGRLVTAGDIEALAQTIGQLIRDPELRSVLGAAGLSHARTRCAPEVVLPEIARVLAGLGATAAA
jgi:glycosyltransferase involved in cell wall biosynthesis